MILKDIWQSRRLWLCQKYNKFVKHNWHRSLTNLWYPNLVCICQICEIWSWRTFHRFMEPWLWHTIDKFQSSVCQKDEKLVELSQKCIKFVEHNKHSCLLKLWIVEISYGRHRKLVEYDFSRHWTNFRYLIMAEQFVDLDFCSNFSKFFGNSLWYIW